MGILSRVIWQFKSYIVGECGYKIDLRKQSIRNGISLGHTRPLDHQWHAVTTVINISFQPTQRLGGPMIIFLVPRISIILCAIVGRKNHDGVRVESSIVQSFE